MFTICDLQLEPERFHYITDLKFLSHANVTTLYSINLGKDQNRCSWIAVERKAMSRPPDVPSLKIRIRIRMNSARLATINNCIAAICLVLRVNISLTN